MGFYDNAVVLHMYAVVCLFRLYGGKGGAVAECGTQHQGASQYGVLPFGAGEGIAVISETDMQSLRRFAESKAEVYINNIDQLRVGAHVKVVDGEFVGMEGVIVGDNHNGNFAVEISGLNLYLSVAIQQELLQPIAPPKPKPVGLLYK